MKKRLCIILLLAALLVLLAGCGEKISLDIQDTAAIELRSGDTGDSVTITDPEIIAQITDNVTSLRYRDIGTRDASGWSYCVRWLDADGNTLGELFPFGWHVEWNGRYYEVSGGTIDTDLFDELLGED